MKTATATPDQPRRPGNVKWTIALDRAARTEARARYADLSAGDRIRAGSEADYVNAYVTDEMKAQSR